MTVSVSVIPDRAGPAGPGHPLCCGVTAASSPLSLINDAQPVCVVQTGTIKPIHLTPSYFSSIPSTIKHPNKPNKSLNHTSSKRTNKIVETVELAINILLVWMSQFSLISIFSLFSTKYLINFEDQLINVAFYSSTLT